MLAKKKDIGDVIIFNATKGGFYSSAQRFFTKMPYTHTAIIIGDILDKLSIFEADLVVTVRPIDKCTEDKSVEWEMWKVSEDVKHKDMVLKAMYKYYAARVYGFSQILWFIYRWFMELFHKDVRKQKNPLGNGDICSELVYAYFQELCKFNNLPSLKAKLAEYDRNSVHVGDIVNIMKACPDIFSKSKEYKLKK